jgi:hypothetical protein
VAIPVDAVVAGVVFGTTLRAIGRGLGSGTFDVAGWVAACADSVRLVANADAKTNGNTVDMAVDRRRGARAKADTAFLRGESLKSPQG